MLAVLSGAVIVLPILAVRYPPAVDLPQHVAQARLFVEGLHDPSGPYLIRWWTPYSALALLIELIWQMVSPALAGRVTLVVLGLMWAGAAHWLAAVRRRPAEAAILATLLFLGLSFYRGLLSFIVGFPPFLLWIQLTTHPPARHRSLKWLGGALLLYTCHALWFAAGLAWLAVALLLVVRPSRRVMIRAVATALPLTIGAAVWWGRLWIHMPRADEWHKINWLELPLARLSPLWLSTATFTGPHGPMNVLMFGAIVLWGIVAVWQHRRTLGAEVDWPLLAAAGLLFLGALMLPNDLSFTILFSERWVDPALVLALLALPSLRVKPWLSRGAAVGLLLAYSLTTTHIWRLFEAESLTGFSAAVDALPENQRVLGLDFVKTSRYLQGWPFVHQVVNAQVEKGGTLGMSFAEFPLTFVGLKEPDHSQKWQLYLEENAKRVHRSDLRYFDYVIVGAKPEAQAKVAEFLGIAPVTTTGLWRLYKVGAAADTAHLQ